MAGCWARIGVWSQEVPSCERLAKVVHCRNCQAYTDAGRALLDRTLPDRYLDENTRDVASRQPVLEADQRGSALLFRIGAEWLALPATQCVTIAPVGPVRRVPHRVDGPLLGLVNVRGRLLLCVALGCLLQLDDAPAPPQAEARMVVVGPDASAWAFPVDEIARVERLSAGALREPPRTLTPSAQAVTRGVLHVGEWIVSLLDGAALSRMVAERISQ